MGFGAALGEGVSAWQIEETRRQKARLAEEESSRAERATTSAENLRAQQASTSAMRGKQIASDIAAFNSPEAKKNRALKQQLENSMLKAQSGVLSDMGYGAVSEQVVQQVQQTAQTVSDNTAVAANDRAFGNMFNDIKETGTVTDYTQISKAMLSDPFWGSILKGPLIRYNEADNKMTQELATMANKVSGDNEATMASITHLAKDGLIGFDAVTGKPYDLMGMAQLTGVKGRLSKTLVDGANTSMQSRMKTAMETEGRKAGDKAGLREEPSWQKGKEGGMKTYTTKSGKEVSASDYTAQLELVKMPIPPQLEAINAHNKELVKDSASGKPDYWAGASPEVAEEAFSNQLVDIANGNDDPVLISRSKAYISNMSGEKQKEKYANSLKLAIDGAKVRNIFDNPKKEELTGDNKVWMENKETANIATADKMYKEAKTYVRSSIAAGERINGILSDMQDFSKDGELLTGLLSDEATQLLSKDSGALDKAADLIKTADTEEAKTKARAKVDRMLSNTIKIDTPLGLELATFIKSMSGAAVSDQERVFLVGIVQAIRRGNPYAVGTALESFRDSRLEMNKQYYTQHNMKVTLPDTMFTAQSKDKSLRTHYEMSDVPSVISTAMGPSATERGGNAVTNFLSDTWDQITGKGKAEDERTQNEKFRGGQ